MAGLGLFFVVIIVLGVFIVSQHSAKVRAPEVPIPSEPMRATMVGAQVCLPHKDTDGSPTKECAQGFRAENGEYYVLDFQLMSQLLPDRGRDESFTASGIVTPIEHLSTDKWHNYDVVGVFSVTNIENALPPESDGAPVPGVPMLPVEESSTGQCYVGGCSSEICSDRPDVASNCLYTEAYACYQTAVCERQVAGACGWTKTPALLSCLNQSGGGMFDQLISDTSLTSKSWEWVSASYSDGRTVVPEEPGRFVLTFDAQGSWSARTDCNGVGGEYTVLGTQLTFDEAMRSTLMYCGESQEVVFQQLLRDTVMYQLTSSGELVFTLKAGSGTVLFR